ncbi:MAG: 30S ribosomal protein S18 [Armatimonadetes bacterium 55-13]|nr:30S ribosomal protein S18 [Armatimonadota bacterium]OJU63021.1 MAG: 30S ribosomal protein S18 [Armatimonadetes bacterium 55-13]
MSEEVTKPQKTETPASAEGQGMRSAPRGDKDSPEPGQRFKNKRRRKVSYLTINKIDKVDYKEINILRRFLNDRGKILPSRQTGNTAKQQRMIASAIRKAREMALLPFVVTEQSNERREYTPRRERYNSERSAPQQAPAAPAAPAAAESTPAAE